MNVKHMVVTVILVTTQLASVHCFGWAVVDIASTILGSIIGVANKTKMWVVEVHNEGRHRAQLWCASKDNKIGGDDGIWVKPGKKIVWAFRRNRFTQFWCKLVWSGQCVAWDVFVYNWRDAPNPTKWSIRDNGVYDQWRNRRWRRYNK